MKKMLSYLWPISKTFPSEINGMLEVTYVNGKKVLDTANANYSYGSLQKILETGLTKINLQAVQNILILGMGGGSIIKSLQSTFEYKNNIVAIEIDPAIISIAEEEFGISPSDKLRIIEEDASKYVKQTSENFGLIVIDLFLDLNVPPIFYEKEFCNNISGLLLPHGSVIFNLGVNLPKNSKIKDNVISHFGKKFSIRTLSKVNGTNTLLILEKK